MMQSQAIKTGVILGGVLLLIGLGVFFVDSKDAVAPTEEGGVAVSQQTEEGGTVEEGAAPTEEAPAPTEAAPAPKPTTATTPVTTAPKPVATTPKPSAYGALITYTDGGFKPSRVTIYEGQTVRFLNQSSRKMWIASNIHPIHAGYQERSEDDCAGSTFDQCEFVDSSEYWDFTFNVVGTWDFHNEAKVTDDGEVTVLQR